MGEYRVERKTRDQLVYKREGNERYLYITRKLDRANNSFLHFESWCRKGPYYGCNEGVDLELRPSGFFAGTLADIYEDLCAIDKAPDQFRFNPYFGNSGSSGKGTRCPVPACEGCPDCHFKTLWTLASDACTSIRSFTVPVSSRFVFSFAFLKHSMQTFCRHVW